MKLSSMGVLVDKTIGAFQGQIKDVLATAEIAEMHHTQGDWGRVVKKLCTSLPTHKALMDAWTLADKYHNLKTVPWGWGQRLLAAADFDEYNRKMQELAENFWACDRAFQAEMENEWDNLMEKEKLRLGGLWREEDYPTSSYLATRSRFDIEYGQIPDNGDIRTTLSADAEKILTAHVQDKERRLIKRMFEPVKYELSRIMSVLSKDKPKVSNTLFEPFGAAIDVLIKLDLDDPELSKMALFAKEQLGTVVPDDVRGPESSKVRQVVVSRAEQLAKQLEKLTK